MTVTAYIQPGEPHGADRSRGDCLRKLPAEDDGPANTGDGRTTHRLSVGRAKAVQTHRSRVLKTVSLFGAIPWVQHRRVAGKSGDKKTRFLGNWNGGCPSSCMRRSPALHYFTPGPEDRYLLKAFTPGPEDRRLLTNQIS